MTITFFIYCETNTFTWADATHVPRVGDLVKESGTYYGDKLKVTEVTWINNDEVEILTERIC